MGAARLHLDEAADTRVFRPHPEIERRRDLVWIGNRGDDERSAELHEFLIGPVRDLRLAAAGIAYLGWLPNFEVSLAFAARAVTVHVPRRPYVELLPGIPTIRPFEAMACAIPLASAPWHDAEGLCAGPHLRTSGRRAAAHPPGIARIETTTDPSPQASDGSAGAST